MTLTYEEVVRITEHMMRSFQTRMAPHVKANHISQADLEQFMLNALRDMGSPVEVPEGDP